MRSQLIMQLGWIMYFALQEFLILSVSRVLTSGVILIRKLLAGVLRAVTYLFLIQ